MTNKLSEGPMSIMSHIVLISEVVHKTTTVLDEIVGPGERVQDNTRLAEEPQEESTLECTRKYLRLLDEEVTYLIAQVLAIKEQI